MTAVPQDFNRLHDLATQLAALTAPGEQQPGLSTWSMFVGQAWGGIAAMWCGLPEAPEAPEPDWFSDFRGPDEIEINRVRYVRAKEAIKA